VGLLMAMPVSAEVVAGSADGFISEHQLIVPVNPDQAYCALTRDIAQRYKAYLSDK
jgi:tryptophanyl-tRNA synthetase